VQDLAAVADAPYIVGRRAQTPWQRDRRGRLGELRPSAPIVVDDGA